MAVLYRFFGIAAVVLALLQPAGSAFGQKTDVDPARTSVHAPTPGNIVQPVAPREPVVAAKALFGAARQPAPITARAIGSYAKGCLAGGVALPVDGPAWQAMRLSRNRNWGHPKLIDLVQRFAVETRAKDGWPGLLVGDLSQPRGGPMLTGHASHQIGLDADIWFTPMPDRKLSATEREEISATSMLAVSELEINAQVFSARHVALLKRAASYPEVERVLVHPAIKKAICDATAGQAAADRGWLTKVRPIWGHYFHFHIRMACPPDSSRCARQPAPPGDDGCGKEVADWMTLLRRPPAPPGPPTAPLTLEQLPQECRAVLQAGR